MRNFGIVYCGQHDASLLAEIRSRFGCLCIRKGSQAGFLIMGKGDDSGEVRGFLRRLSKEYGQDKVITGTRSLDLKQMGEFFALPRFFQRDERVYTVQEVVDFLNKKEAR
jgi:hypothetical protein